jgi:hypothetical protein
MTSGHLDLLAREAGVQFVGSKALSGVTPAVPRSTRAELPATVRLSST